MCRACWEEYGSPQIVNEMTLLASRLIKRCDPYGALHVIVDDWNIEDEFLGREPYLTYSGEDLALLTALREMDIGQRASAMALAQGIIHAPSP